MKLNLRVLGISFFSLFILTSCSNNDNSDNQDSGINNSDYIYYISGKINGVPFIYGQTENATSLDYSQPGFGNSITTTCAYYPDTGGLNYNTGVYPNLDNEARPRIYFEFVRFYLCSSDDSPWELFNESFPVGSYGLASSGSYVSGSTGDVGVFYTSDSTNNDAIYLSYGEDQSNSYFNIDSSTNTNVVLGDQVLSRSQLIEGTFAIKLHNEIDNSDVEITDGQFKLYVAFD